MDVNLESIIGAKPSRRWALTEHVAKQKKYTKIKSNIYQKSEDYLIKAKRSIIYLEDITKEDYKEIQNSLIRPKLKNPTAQVLLDATTVGFSTLGGAAIGGYCFIKYDLPAWIMIPAILGPLAISMYNLIRSSSKLSKEEKGMKKTLEKYDSKIFMDESAIKKLFSK